VLSANQSVMHPNQPLSNLVRLADLQESYKSVSQGKEHLQHLC